MLDVDVLKILVEKYNRYSLGTSKVDEFLVIQLTIDTRMPSETLADRLNRFVTKFLALTICIDRMFASIC